MTSLSATQQQQPPPPSSSCRRRHHRHRRCLLLAPLFFFLGLAAFQPIASAAKAPSGALGSITPHGQVYRKVGDEVRLICNLANATDKFNSKGLTFTWPGAKTSRYATAVREQVPKEFVRTLNNSAIELVLPSVSEGAPMITCMHRDPVKGKEIGIAYTELTVGHAPRPVTNFRCISNNWQSLNCTFEFSDNIVFTDYNLTYRRVGSGLNKNQSLLPFVNETIPVYWFKLNDYTAVTEEYVFIVDQTNVFGNLSQEFFVNNFKSIRPDKPLDLATDQLLHEPGQPVNLTWRVSMDLLVYETLRSGYVIMEINYTSTTYHNRQWVSIVREYKPYQLNNGCFLLLNNLTAYTWYDVRIRLRISRSDPDRDELWSDYGTYVFQTASRRPDKPPQTDIGAFWVNDLNDVLIYWKMLKDYERNGENASYVITKSLASGKPMLVRPTIGLTSAKYTNTKDETMEFEVRSSNEKGLSERSSFVRVPRKAERIPHPTELKKNRNGTIYTLSWRAPKDGGRNVTSYTVFWCKSKSELPNQCEESIYFERVNANVKEFTINTTDGINFAVSANSWNSSSGMVWALCTASESDDIGKLKTIWTPKITATSMEIQWNLECVDRPIVREYNISYCPITSPRDLTCKDGTELFATLSSGETQYKINGLKPYTTYRTIITMISDTRIGPPSEPRVNTTYEATPSKPLNLIANEIKNTSVLLRWNAPENMNGVLNNYEVWYNENRKEVYDFLGKQNVSFLLTDLTSFTDYEIVVRACSNCCNCSESSNSVKIRTDIGTPGMVVVASPLFDEGKRSVDIRWKPPSPKAGPVDFYEVKLDMTTDNYTIITRLLSPGCIQNFDMDIDGTGVQKESKIYVRAVNVLWSGHAKKRELSPLDEETSEEYPSARFQRHSSQGPDSAPHAQLLEIGEPKKKESFVTFLPPVSLKYCDEEDYKVRELLDLDKYEMLLPGPWSMAYTHLGNSKGLALKTITAFMVVFAMLVCLSMWLYKKCYKRKKGSVVLPSGLADIVEENPQNGGKSGGFGGILDSGLSNHGNSMIIVSGEHSLGDHHRAILPDVASDDMYDRKSCSSAAPMVFDDDYVRHHRHAAEEMQSGGSSEINSMHEQEQSLLEDRLDAQSNSSASSSASGMEHQAILGNAIRTEAEERLPISLEHEVLSAMMANKYAQQQQQQQQQQQSQPQSAVPNCVITQGTNGYVTIAQRPGGYTKLGDLMKPAQMTSPVEDKGITGYVTHKQLADFGQRMQ